MARRVSPSVVFVEGPGGEARGFVFGSSRRIVAPLDVAVAGRGIVVRGPSGDEVSARVLSVDEENNLAVLEIDAPFAGASPLEPSQKTLERGLSVLSFAAVDPSKPADLVTLGTITRVHGQRFNTSARNAPHSTWGGPLVDCEGNVVGIASGFGDRATSVRVLAPLLLKSDHAPSYSSGWSLAHPAMGVELATAPHMPWVGVYLGVSLVGDDRFELSLRSHLSAYAPPDKVPGTTETGLRLGLESRVGYRFLLTEGFAPLYLVPSVGVAGEWEDHWRTTTRLSAVGDGCSLASLCQSRDKKNEGSRLWAAPVFGAALRYGPGELGYSLQVDHFGPTVLTHTFNLGFQL